MPKYLAITSFISFSIGLILLICYPIIKGKNKRCSAQTEGMLVNIFETTDSDGNVGHGYIYSYCVNGIQYQLKSTALNKQVEKVGDHCTIWYNPAKPKEAQEFHYESDKVFKIILIIGIVLVVLAILLPIIGAMISAMIGSVA